MTKANRPNPATATYYIVTAQCAAGGFSFRDVLGHPARARSDAWDIARAEMRTIEAFRAAGIVGGFVRVEKRIGEHGVPETLWTCFPGSGEWTATLAA